MDIRYRYGSLIDTLALPLAGDLPLRDKLRYSQAAKRVRRNVQTASTWNEHLAMIEAILSVPKATPGVVVEAGCYRGGSTASLSLACRDAGRKLYVFDSFAGLPDPEGEDAKHHVGLTGEAHTYAKGAFAGSLDDVKANVERYGAIEVCTFVPGYFEDTMPDFHEPVVFAFVDADLTESVETCLRRLWPLLHDGCQLWTHEAHHSEIAGMFYDRDLWSEIGDTPPGLVGGGSGLGLSNHLVTPIGFATKSPAPVREIVEDWR